MWDFVLIYLDFHIYFLLFFVVLFSSKKEDPISFEILHVTVKKTFSKNENIEIDALMEKRKYIKIVNFAHINNMSVKVPYILLKFF